MPFRINERIIVNISIDISFGIFINLSLIIETITIIRIMIVKKS